MLDNPEFLLVRLIKVNFLNQNMCNFMYGMVLDAIKPHAVNFLEMLLGIE